MNGELQLQKKKVIWVDDYGHHPTEIEKTIEAIRESYPEKKISMVFQPHRFSRTKYLLKEFINVFQLPDEPCLAVVSLCRCIQPFQIQLMIVPFRSI